MGQTNATGATPPLGLTETCWFIALGSAPATRDGAISNQATSNTARNNLAIDALTPASADPHLCTLALTRHMSNGRRGNWRKQTRNLK